MNVQELINYTPVSFSSLSSVFFLALLWCVPPGVSLDLFFFFFFCLFCCCCCYFLGRSRGIWRFPGQGSNRSCSHWLTLQPQQCQIWATSATSTTAHDHTRIFNPLREAWDRTCNLMVPGQTHFRCTTMGTPWLIFMRLFWAVYSVPLISFYASTI